MPEPGSVKTTDELKDHINKTAKTSNTTIKLDYQAASRIAVMCNEAHQIYTHLASLVVNPRTPVQIKIQASQECRAWLELMNKMHVGNIPATKQWEQYFTKEQF